MGAVFITLLPYGIDTASEFLPRSWRFGSTVFGVQVGAVGPCIILFLLFEPKGLAEIWRRVETYSSVGRSVIGHSIRYGGDSMADNLLEVRQLEVVYNRVATAIQGVSLEVRMARLSRW